MQLKLYYFGVRGRAEHIRQILKLANVPYQEVTITFDTWPNYKGEMPLGQVPVLEVDGIKIGQSVAIARFLGEQFGMVPNSPIARARLDMIADQISDTLSAEGVREWPRVCLGMIPCEDKAAYYREKVRPKMDDCANVLEKFLVENDDATLLGKDKITWVDVYAAEFFSKNIDYGEKDCIQAYPHIQALVDRVHNEPAIKKYISERTATPF